VFSYKPDYKTDLINFMDLKLLCKNFWSIKPFLDHQVHVDAHTAMGVCAHLSSESHIVNLYEDITKIDKLSTKYQVCFIKSIFNNEHILPQLAAERIAFYMNQEMPCFPSKYGPNCFPYPFNYNRQVLIIYEKYARIFAAIQVNLQDKMISFGGHDNRCEIDNNTKTCTMRLSRALCLTDDLRLAIMDVPATRGCTPYCELNTASVLKTQSWWHDQLGRSKAVRQNILG